VYACICHAVTVADVTAHVRDGADTVEAVGRACGAGTGCGSCREGIGAIITGARSADDTAAAEPLQRAG
jgi:bacterioferritin-associated ferredoxin